MNCMADGESKGQDSPAAASPRPPRSQSAAAAALSTVVDVSSQLHAQLQSALTSLREGNSAAAASKPARALGFGPETALVDHLKRVDLFFRGQLEPYPRDEVKDTGAAKARRVLGSGLKLLKWVAGAGCLRLLTPCTTSASARERLASCVCSQYTPIPAVSTDDLVDTCC